jgi:RNA polymerase sigma-32 factor
MNARLSGIDSSLSVSASDDETPWQDRLADEKVDQETEIGDRDEKRQHLRSVALALPRLPAREQEIIRARFLTDKPIPFAVLATRYAVTPQRIRQIESRAVAKLRALMKNPWAVEIPPVLQYAA